MCKRQRNSCDREQDGRRGPSQYPHFAHKANQRAAQLCLCARVRDSTSERKSERGVRQHTNPSNKYVLIFPCKIN